MWPLVLRQIEVRPTHNNQIKKEALRAPIIQGVMCFDASANRLNQTWSKLLNEWKTVSGE